MLIVISGLGTGGTQRSIAEMLPALLEDGIEPEFACLKLQQQGVEGPVRDQGFQIHFLRSSRMVGRIRELRRLIRSGAFDLVHTSIFEADLAGRMASVGLGVPVLTSLVHTPYDPVRRRDPKVKPRRMRAVQLVDAWTARHMVSHFHAVTRAVKVAAVQALGVPEDRITVIARGRDPARLGRPSLVRRQEARMKLGLAADDEVVINVARQEFQKGQEFLLEAAATLAHSRPRLVTLIAGRAGNSSAELERISKARGLGEMVRFLGHRDDVPDLLAAADVFVFPSLYEGIAGAIIEAMALALPVVASDLETLREVVEADDNALLVPRGSSSDLASAITRVLDDPDLRARMGRRSLEIFTERFSGDRHGHLMAELYRRLVDGVC